jgi:nucleotide-binding universal stress UspA family protein
MGVWQAGETMAQDVFVVAYDGTDQQPVDFAVDRAARDNAALVIVHVLEWSPYSFLTTAELSERHRARQQEVERAEEAVMKPVLERVRAAGITADGELRYGHVVDILCAIAKEKSAAMIIVGRSCSLSTRVFGSVASGVAQSAMVPVVIVPCG